MSADRAGHLELERLVELVEPSGRDAGPAAAQLRVHVESCAECRAELALLREGWQLAESALAPPSPQLLERVRHTVLADRKPRVLVPALAGGIAALVLMLAMGLLPQNADPLVLGSTALLLPAYVFGLLAAVGHRRARAAFVGLALPGLALSIASHPAPDAHGAVCFPFAGAMSLAALAVTGLWLRKAALSTADGAFWGAAAGVIGMTVFRLHCPWEGWPHALAFHATVIPLTAGLGALAARWLYSNTPRSTTLATEK